MAAPIRFLSGRQQQQKIGIEGSTDNQKVLEVVGQVGIGTTVFEPSVQLEVRGDASVSGVLTTGSLNVTGDGGVPASLTVETLNATGVSTFGGAVDINAGLDVDGQSDLDELVVAGVATFSNAVDINSTLDVDGDTQLDDLNVAGVATFSSAVNATDIIKGYKYTAVPYGSTVTLAVTVASKDSTHRYNGTGSGNGYVIDGIQAPFLTLTPGRTYRFTNDNTGSHPLKFYLEADKTTLYETNVNFQDAYTEITVTDQTPIVLHYQCTAHGFMGNAVQTNANVVNTNYPATIRSTLDVSGVSTFTQLDVSTGGIDVDGQTNLDELVVAGVSTFTGNIVADTAEFAGNVTVGGTLFSENKTNIDSVGLVTARTGVRIITGGIDVSAGFSTFNDFVSINDGLNVVGGFTADSLTISGVTTGINAAGISSFVRIDVDGQADLDEVVIAGVATFQGAVNFDVNSEINIGTGVTILGNNLHVTGIVSAAQFVGDGSGITNLPGISTLGSSNLTDVNVSGTTTTAQLRISGIGTAENFFVSTGGFEVDGQSDLDELVVAGVSTFSANTFINADLSVTGDIGASGIITATGIQLVAGSGLDVGAVGVLTALSVDVSTGGIDVDGQATLDEVVVAGVATFSALADVNNRLDVAGGANIDQLNVAGIASFTQLDVSTGGIDVDGQATLDEVVVSGASTFTGTVKIDGALDISTAGVDIDGLTNLDELIVAGVSTFSSTINGNVTGNLTGTASNASGATGDFSIADKIVHTGDTNTAIRFPADDTVTVETAGSEKLRITGIGSVGIGIDDPQYKIHVRDTNGSVVSIDRDGGLANLDFIAGLRFGNNDSSGSPPHGTGIKVVADGTFGSAKMHLLSGGRGAWKNDEYAMTINSDDDIGIGTDKPANRLEIFDTDSVVLKLNSTNANGANLIIQSNKTDKMFVGLAGDFITGQGSNVTDSAIRASGDFLFASGGGTERLRITSAGNVNFLGSLVNVNATGVSSFVQLDVSTGGLDVDGQTDLDELQVAGVSTFNDDVRITAGGLNVASGIVSATQLDIGSGGLDVDGQTDLDELQVAGVSIFNDDVRITAGGLNVASGIVSATQLDIGSGGADVGGTIRSNAADFAGILRLGGGSSFHGKVEYSYNSGSDKTLTLNSVGAGGAIVFQSNNSEKFRVVSTGTTFSDKAVFNALADVNNRLDVAGGANIDQLNVAGIASFVQLDVSTGGLDVDGQTDLDELQVAGVSTFSAKAIFNTAYPSIDADNEIQVGTAIQLGKAGVITATSFSGDGSALTGIAATDHVSTFDLVVAGVSTFIGNARFETLSGSGSIVFNNSSGSGGVLADSVNHTISGDTLNTVNIVAQGNITVADKLIHRSDDNTTIRFPANDTIAAETAGVERLRINSVGDIQIAGIVTATGLALVAGSGLDAGATGIVTAVGAEFNGTSHIKLPAGSTGQRPGSPTAGDLRYNSDDGAFEGYTDSWGAIGGGTPEVDTNVSSTSAVGVGSFATASFRSAEVVAQIVQIDKYQVGKYLMIHDGTTVTVIEQAAVATGDSMIGSFDGAINGSNVELRVTMVSSGIATVTTKISTVTV